MKKRSIVIALLFWSGVQLFCQSTALFEEDKVASIYLELPPDSLDYMINNVVHTRYLEARFVFDDGMHRDTLEAIGLRLRGNTSLGAQKKSFKISFNEFVPGRAYQGVKKLNLRGQHNDPTMVREKLFYDVWGKAGMPDRRAAFVKLYINQAYRGLYTNLEEIDKTWLERTYVNGSGNLYKCTWPADLAYIGPSQEVYKAIMNNPEERAYDLKTNETADDYSRLVALITALNQPVGPNFPGQISQILHVESVLKAFAIDVATGNWDDYFYNKNNYYLYDNPASGRFEFVTFDTDNTFGVDWLGKDWAKRNCLAWLPSGQPRPLATKLLAVPAFRDQYIRYLDSLTRFITLPDSIFPHIDALENRIADPAQSDLYRTLDYGYDLDDFHNGFDQTIDGHTPYGIKPFLGIRHDSTLRQIAGLLSGTASPGFQPPVFEVYPNPASDWLYIRASEDALEERVAFSVYGTNGACLQSGLWETPKAQFAYPVGQLPPGVYWLRWQTATQAGQWMFLKVQP